MADILITSLIISFFCLGLHEVSREGRVLYFVRKPFEGLDEMMMILRGEENKRYTHTQLFSLQVAEFISKPLILCPPCMASIWGIIIFSILHGFPRTWEVAAYMVICCIISSFFNSFLHTLLEKLES